MPRLVCPNPANGLRAGFARHDKEHAVPVKPRHRGDLGQSIQRQIARRSVVDVLNHPSQPRFVIDHLRVSDCLNPVLHQGQETRLAELQSAIRLQKPTVPAI